MRTGLAVTSAGQGAVSSVFEYSRQEASPFHPMLAPGSLAGLATTTVLTDFGKGTGAIPGPRRNTAAPRFFP